MQQERARNCSIHKQTTTPVRGKTDPVPATKNSLGRKTELPIGNRTVSRELASCKYSTVAARSRRLRSRAGTEPVTTGFTRNAISKSRDVADNAECPAGSNAANVDIQIFFWLPE